MLNTLNTLKAQDFNNGYKEKYYYNSLDFNIYKVDNIYFLSGYIIDSHIYESADTLKEIREKAKKLISKNKISNNFKNKK